MEQQNLFCQNPTEARNRWSNKIHFVKSQPERDTDGATKFILSKPNRSKKQMERQNLFCQNPTGARNCKGSASSNFSIYVYELTTCFTNN